MCLNKAKEILDIEYNKWYVEIEDSYQKDLMDEKIRHSYQVLGAGNFLLSHEDCFVNSSKLEIDKLKAIVLLHDVGRFYEAYQKTKGEKLDHGVFGAEYLKQFPMFNDMYTYLAIKHHGHMIEELYEDEIYSDLLEDEQIKVRNISFLVRDADKLANFYLLVSHFAEVKDLFFCKTSFETPYEININPKVMEDFLANRCVLKADCKNFADWALLVLSWIFDLNFKSSFLFMARLQIVDRLCQCFSCFWEDGQADAIKECLSKFIENE
jgi:hypothetical protein